MSRKFGIFCKKSLNLIYDKVYSHIILIVGFTRCLAFVTRRNSQLNTNRFAIQNVQTGKNLRPFEAGNADGNKLVLYNHHSWKCMTWDFIKVEDETFKLLNRYTKKTFQTEGKPAANAKLFQQPLNKDTAQVWEFIRQADETYLIKLKGTELYISISSEKANSEIVLLPLKNSKKQLWRLVKQNPIF